jgi:hypothetical protein
MKQKITTTRNATAILYDGSPILATDPWIGDEDAAYFGSWILSHEIPNELKDDISQCKYIWFSHGHPDHLNSTSLEKFKGKKIILPNHVGSRIYNDLKEISYDVTLLPDRKWVYLSGNIKNQTICTYIQDAILLIDICGKLFINLNDAGTKGCANYIRKISQQYKYTFLLSISGYGDADMINFHNESGEFVESLAAKKIDVGIELSKIAKLTGANSVIPFSSFHQYQREDTLWAQKILHHWKRIKLAYVIN